MCVSWAERTCFGERLEGTEDGLPGFQGLELPVVSAGATEIEEEMQPGDREQPKGNCVRWYRFFIAQGEEKKALIFLEKNDGNGVLGGGILLPGCDAKNKCLHRW